MSDRPESDQHRAPAEATGAGAPPPPSSPAPSGDGVGLPPPAVRPPDGAEPRPARRARADLGSVAVAAGLISLVARYFLMADPTARYLVLAAALIAVALGVWSLWVAYRYRSADLVMALAASVTGGLSIYLYISYVTASPGST